MRTEDGYFIDKCLNKEPAAFGLLVEKYKSGIYALAYAKLGNFHDAEDITQEVFLKAYQKLRTLRRGDNFHAWLYAITSNLCKNFLRSQSRRPDRELIANQAPKNNADSSMAAYHKASLYEPLYEALEELPEIHRQVLTLYYLGGMSSREIAQFLGMSESTINMRLSRARARLKAEMLEMLGTKKLRPGFTLHIEEMIQQTKIQPVQKAPWLPWGLSLATGLFFVLLNLGPTQISLNPIRAWASHPIPSEIRIMQIGEIPVDAVKIDKIFVFGHEREKHEFRGTPRRPKPQNAARALASVEEPVEPTQTPMLALADETSKASSRGHTVVFPDDLLMGTLYVRDRGWKADLWQKGFMKKLGFQNQETREGWQKLGPAQGSVTVPEGKELRLEVARLAADDLSWLATLKPNDLQRIDLAHLANNSELGHLKKLTGMKALSFKAANLRHAGMVHIKGLEGLEELDLSDTYVTNAGLRHLREMRHLKRLDLRETSISAPGLVHIVNLRSLESLHLPSFIGDRALAQLSTLTSLKQLDLGDTQISDAGLAHLKGLVNLQWLDLGVRSISDAGLVHLKGLVNLQWLNLQGTSISDVGLAHLKGLTNLHGLYLASRDITNAGLAHLSGLTKLQWLDLESNGHITSEALAHLKDIPLRGITLTVTQMDDTALAHLGEISTLEILTMWSDRITDAGVAHLQKLKSLQYLVLGAQLGDEGLAHLAGLTELRFMAIHGSEISDAGMVHLARLTNLQVLGLDSTRISDEGVAHLTGLTKLHTNYGSISY